MKKVPMLLAFALALLAPSAAWAHPTTPPPPHIDCQFTSWQNRLYGPTFKDRGMTLQPVVQALSDATTGDYCGQLRSTAGFQRGSGNCNDWLYSALFDGTQFEGYVGPIQWNGCGGTGWFYVWSNPVTTSGCMDAWGEASVYGGSIYEVAGRSLPYCP